MAGAMNPEGLTGLPHVKRWLGYSQAAVSVVEELGKDMTDDEKMSFLIEQNVLLQLQHLRTHPSVAAALAKGQVELHGWVYDIKSGGVTAYDETQKQFLFVDERYAKEMAQMAAHNNCAA